MKKYILTGLGLAASLLSFSQSGVPSEWKGKIAKSPNESTPYKIDYLKHAPEGAPNVLLILLDDVGFGAISTFGGLINTPNLDTLANNGLRYSNFHTTGVCSPTRAALLTGRNHNSVGMGLFPHVIARGDYPGYTGFLQSENGTFAEVLKENGYGTYQLGKWHLTPDEEITDLGPFDRWPSGKGFDHNYGFLGGATDQYKPELVEDNQHVTPDGNHLNTLLANKAIAYLTRQKTLAPEKPFFLYFATGAAHAPHQVDPVWSNKYKGKFDAGWDVYREKVFANQKKLGLIPANAVLPERNQLIKAWKDLQDEDKKLFTRFFEVYAGFLEQTDFEIGRIIKHLKTTGQLDNTAIFVIIGDNGASKEGTEYGVVTKSNWGFEKVKREDYHQSVLNQFDKIGGKEVSTEANYPLGWAQATNTPFKFWKSDANAEGATHNPLIVSYPKLIKEKGGVRNQYSHLIDIFPTILEITGIKQPETIRNVKQTPLQGTSLFFSINDKAAPSRHNQQYYNILGNRAIYKDGWKASAARRPNLLDIFPYAGETAAANLPKNPDEDIWELYNLNEDFNERINLADKNPEKLKELKALFDEEAKKYNVYPLLDPEYLVNKGAQVYFEQLKKSKAQQQ